MVNYFEPQRDEGTFFLRMGEDIAMKLRIFLSRILQKHRGRFSQLLQQEEKHERSLRCALPTHVLPLLHGSTAFIFAAYRAIAFAIANLLESAKRKKIAQRKRGRLIAPSLLTDGGYGLKHRFKTLIFRHLLYYPCSHRACNSRPPFCSQREKCRNS